MRHWLRCHLIGFWSVLVPGLDSALINGFYIWKCALPFLQGFPIAVPPKGQERIFFFPICNTWSSSGALDLFCGLLVMQVSWWVIRWSKATWLVKLTQKWPFWITPRQLSCLKSWLQGTDLLVIKNRMFYMPSKISEISYILCFMNILKEVISVPSFSSNSYLMKL